jgi:hypothetical protein
MHEFYSIAYMYFIMFIQTLVDVHKVQFHTLAIVNSATINTGVLVSLPYADLHPCRYVPKGDIAISSGSSIFSFLGNLYANFYSDWTSLHYHQCCISVHFFPAS